MLLPLACTLRLLVLTTTDVLVPSHPGPCLDPKSHAAPSGDARLHRLVDTTHKTGSCRGVGKRRERRISHRVQSVPQCAEGYMDCTILVRHQSSDPFRPVRFHPMLALYSPPCISLSGFYLQASGGQANSITICPVQSSGRRLGARGGWRVSRFRSPAPTCLGNGQETSPNERSGDLTERGFSYASCSSSSMRLTMSSRASWKYLA
jgi:hypothetical protein